MENVKIENDIEIPPIIYTPQCYKRQCIDTLLVMEVGESILVENRTAGTVKAWLRCIEFRLHRYRTYKSKYYDRYRDNPFKYQMQSVDNQKHRIWRV